jgi:hypothetical protein
MVALSGDQLEDIARARNVAEEQLAYVVLILKFSNLFVCEFIPRVSGTTAI